MEDWCRGLLPAPQPTCPHLFVYNVLAADEHLLLRLAEAPVHGALQERRDFSAAMASPYPPPGTAQQAARMLPTWTLKCLTWLGLCLAATRSLLLFLLLLKEPLLQVLSPPLTVRSQRQL